MEIIAICDLEKGYSSFSIPHIATGTVICPFLCSPRLKSCISLRSANILFLMEKIGTNMDLLVKYVVDNKSL